MKIAEGLALIKHGWIRKPQGFRVRFDRPTATGIEQVYSPPRDEMPLNSDVTAWRYAWKLRQSTVAKANDDRSGAFYNIVVVDDQDRPVRFFVNGEHLVYNPKQ